MTNRFFVAETQAMQTEEKRNDQKEFRYHLPNQVAIYFKKMGRLERILESYLQIFETKKRCSLKGHKTPSKKTHKESNWHYSASITFLAQAEV